MTAILFTIGPVLVWYVLLYSALCNLAERGPPPLVARLGRIWEDTFGDSPSSADRFVTLFFVSLFLPAVPLAYIGFTLSALLG